MESTLLTLLFLLSTITASAVAVVGWRRRRVTHAVGTLAVVAAAIAAWAATDAFLIAADVLATSHLALTAKLLPACAVTAGFFCLSQAVLDRTWRLSRRTALWLAVEPALIVTTVASDPWHHLLFPPTGPGLQDVRQSGIAPLFWAHTAYSYTLLAIGLAALLRAWMRGPRSQRELYGLVLLGTVPPLLINVLSTVGFVRPHLTPLGFCVTVVVGYWALVRRALPELVSVERSHLFDMISDMVMAVDCSGRLLDLNPSAERMLRDLVPDLPERLAGLPVTGILGDPPLGDDMETDSTVTDVNGRRVDLNVRVSALRNGQDEHVGWALVTRDVTALNAQRRELQETNDQLREQVRTVEALRADLAEQAVRDTLTGLHNRRFLMESLGREMKLAAAEGTPLSVALLDIDHFKQINDRYGHTAGDQVLMRFAKLLGGRVRQGDVLARYGGEEFVVVLPGATGEQAQARVDELRQWVTAGRIPAGGHTLSVTFSAGVAALDAGQNPGELLHVADEALYEAKRAGRNRVQLAAPEPDPSAAAA
ncbi:diguanylate cyclase [Planomonospora sp. ID67723]|uniref:histidine kinase N-terminal 7TM domain-containing diguanylate cyclase n=1 Tax=Planomonospora sp. ID67723 TaxID=2738134 RepID=UPI0018C3FC7F|nr:diguanylate cyclase [Planomonospora sp. ID67723]MBG0833203.1 diguanylate cyclase [Planomonospora sp. ID67723]